MKLLISYLTVLITASFLLLNAQKAIHNPYEHIDWKTCKQYKTNLHTHTTESDGDIAPNEVIDKYVKNGYTILSITDHNKNTWPWSKWGQYPDSLNVLAVSGCEASRHHHLNGFLCDYDGSHKNIDSSLSYISQHNGLAQLNHPGRYSKDVSWYIDLFNTYDSLLAIEVYNQGDRYKTDRTLWDEILTRMMPERPVWATSNDDLHKAGHFGRNWQIMLTNDRGLTLNTFRKSFKDGCFYACYDMSGTGGNAVLPDSIVVDNHTIKVYAGCSPSTIHWISNGKDIHQGAIFTVDSMEQAATYVRPVIYGEKGARTLIQPFGLSDK